MLLQYDHKKIIASGVFFVFLVGAVSFFYGLTPVAAGDDRAVAFAVASGEGFREIQSKLYAEKLIRSRFGFTVLALTSGRGKSMRPGEYLLSPSMSSLEVLHMLTDERDTQIVVTIPEGMSVYKIDALLASRKIITPGSLVSLVTAQDLEGKLFPDTYHFFLHSRAEDVVAVFLSNFERKAIPLLPKEARAAQRTLILASLLESEVPDYEERRLVAGVLEKRSASGMPLQVDATICYLKEMEGDDVKSGCYPLTSLDFKTDSLYNTYMRRGLPPAPIGNPGEAAIKAALDPKSSGYWYYLSDPETRKTIFSQTLDEHAANRVKYLGLR